VTGYWSPVRRILALLALLAVIVMPFGMAPAQASPVEHHAMAGMAMDHCPDQQGPKAPHGGFDQCTMACAAALPALDAPRAAAPMIVCEPLAQPAAERLHGLHPETATPPPKRS